jgi:hypothetical protein
MAPTVGYLQGGREVLLLPASIYRSELTGTPTDRFRIGIGRLDPEPARILGTHRAEVPVQPAVAIVLGARSVTMSRPRPVSA